MGRRGDGTDQGPVLLVTPGDSGFPDSIQVTSCLTTRRTQGLTNYTCYFSRIQGWKSGIRVSAARGALGGPVPGRSPPTPCGILMWRRVESGEPQLLSGLLRGH